jgi:serine/threonine protein kinase
VAPEILLGKKYNELVDVYSYAMCLVEVVDHNLPWHNYGGAAEVPYKVTKEERPLAQLEHPESQLLCGLIQRCWSTEPADRPNFGEIVAELEASNGFTGDE